MKSLLWLWELYNVVTSGGIAGYGSSWTNYWWCTFDNHSSFSRKIELSEIRTRRHTHTHVQNIFTKLVSCFKTQFHHPWISQAVGGGSDCLRQNLASGPFLMCINAGTKTKCKMLINNIKLSVTITNYVLACERVSTPCFLQIKQFLYT
jgi:hypothetical protein